MDQYVTKILNVCLMYVSKTYAQLLFQMQEVNANNQSNVRLECIVIITQIHVSLLKLQEEAVCRVVNVVLDTHVFKTQ